jgi:hypothetical protein
VNIQLSGRISEAVIPDDEVKKEMYLLNKKAVDLEKNGPILAEIQPTSSAVLTIPDLVSTVQEYGEVLTGKKLLYVFIVSNYEDEIIEGKSYWHIDHCSFFQGTTVFYHNCYSNTITKITGSRYQ